MHEITSIVSVHPHSARTFDPMMHSGVISFLGLSVVCTSSLGQYTVLVHAPPPRCGRKKQTRPSSDSFDARRPRRPDQKQEDEGSGAILDTPEDTNCTEVFFFLVVDHVTVFSR